MPSLTTLVQRVLLLTQATSLWLQLPPTHHPLLRPHHSAAASHHSWLTAVLRATHQAPATVEIHRADRPSVHRFQSVWSHGRSARLFVAMRVSPGRWPAIWRLCGDNANARLVCLFLVPAAKAPRGAAMRAFIVHEFWPKRPVSKVICAYVSDAPAVGTNGSIILPAADGQIVTGTWPQPIDAFALPAADAEQLAADWWRRSDVTFAYEAPMLANGSEWRFRTDPLVAFYRALRQHIRGRLVLQRNRCGSLSQIPRSNPPR